MVPDGYLLTAQGKMHILFSDPLKLLAEARQQWIQAVVMPQARAREVPIPASLDVDEIRSALKTSGTYNVVAANVPAGAQFSAAQKTHVEGAICLCKYCGQSDSFRHLYLHCSHTQPCRDGVDANFLLRRMTAL